MRLFFLRINEERNECRWYRISIQETLFGDFDIVREWGRVGNRGGQILCEAATDYPRAIQKVEKLKRERLKRGYQIATKGPPEMSMSSSNAASLSSCL